MPDFAPLRLLLVTFAGWVNWEQANLIDYLVKLGGLLQHYHRAV